MTEEFSALPFRYVEVAKVLLDVSVLHKRMTRLLVNKSFAERSMI